MSVREKLASDKMNPSYLLYTLKLVLKQIDDSRTALNLNEDLFFLNLFTWLIFSSLSRE
jgi:hypothetical protein